MQRVLNELLRRDVIDLEQAQSYGRTATELQTSPLLVACTRTRRYDEIAEALAELARVEVASDLMPDPELLALVGLDDVDTCLCLPLRKRGSAIEFGMVDPSDVEAIDRLGFVTGHRIVPVGITFDAWLFERHLVPRGEIVPEALLDAAIAQAQNHATEIDAITDLACVMVVDSCFSGVPYVLGHHPQNKALNGGWWVVPPEDPRWWLTSKVIDSLLDMAGMPQNEGNLVGEFKVQFREDEFASFLMDFFVGPAGERYLRLTRFTEAELFDLGFR